MDEQINGDALNLRAQNEEVTQPVLTTTPPKKKSSLIELLKFAFIAAVIVIPVRMFIAQPFVVSGSSMVPTFHDADYLIVDELSYHLRDPQRGEVIVFRYPNDPTKFFIKRVIGLPGETIKIKGSEVTILNKENPDGFIMNEPYVQNKSSDVLQTTLGETQYFAMGDNRIASSDSRSWGNLDRKYMVGRALLRIVPFKDAGTLPGYYQQ